MKNKSMVLILMGLMMFTSCSLSAANEKQPAGGAVVAEAKAEEVGTQAGDAQADTTAQSNSNAQADTTAQSNSNTQANAAAQSNSNTQSTNNVQVTDASVYGSEVQVVTDTLASNNLASSVSGKIIYTSSNAYTNYLATKYVFAADGLSGTFTVSVFDAYTKDYVDSLKVGDTIQNGVLNEDENGKVDYENLVIESLEKDDENKRVWINDCYCFTLQENGDYYLEDGAGFKNASDAGQKTLKIASDVKIVDNADPFWNGGIRENYDGADYFNSVANFVDRLDDEDVWYQPDLYLRVENDEVKVIVVNPANHEPWYGESGEALFED